MKLRIVGLLIVLMLVFASSALAADPVATETQAAAAGGETRTTAASEPVTTAATGATGNPGTSEGSSGGSDNRGIAIAIFILGALGVGFAYLFYDRWRQSYQTLALSALTKNGVFPDTIVSPEPGGGFGARKLEQGGGEEPIQIVGPETVVVGEPTTFRATLGGAAADSCTWTIEPAEAATVVPAGGAEVTVTASKAGTFKLLAAGAQGNPTTAEVTAIAKSEGGGVPLLGTGFAGVAAAIIAFSLAGGLAALDILGGEAFIAFLGPVVGYFFAQAKDGGGQGATP